MACKAVDPLVGERSLRIDFHYAKESIEAPGPLKTRLKQTTFPIESLPDNVFPNNTGESSSRARSEGRKMSCTALLPTHPFETSTALAAAILTLWSGEVESAAAATAATIEAVAGVINCGVLEVERRVLGLDAKVGTEDKVITNYLVDSYTIPLFIFFII